MAMLPAPNATFRSQLSRYPAHINPSAASNCQCNHRVLVAETDDFFLRRGYLAAQPLRMSAR
jgi:hypothetical protein